MFSNKAFRSSTLLTAILVLGFSACDRGSSNADGRRTDSDAGDTAGKDAMDADAATAVDTDTELDGDPHTALSGNWALLINASSKQTGIPLLGSQVAVSRSFFLAEVSPGASGELISKEQPCAIYVKLDTWFNRLIVPRVFAESSRKVLRHIEIRNVEPGTPWVSDDVYDVRGAVLADPASDPLPENGSGKTAPILPCDEAQPGAACDQDNDGKPGMTNFVSGALSCEIYVAQRWHAQLGGAVVDKNRIEGPLLAAETEQSVLAASRPLCEGGELASVSVFESCPEHFYFKMLRLKDGATCDDVMAISSCDEDQARCEGDTELPLNPRHDHPASCH